MAAFKVGDRVRMKPGYVGVAEWDNALGTVGDVIGDYAICVHFDEPALEGQQSYESGWATDVFEKVEDPHELINEDWS